MRVALAALLLPLAALSPDSAARSRERLTVAQPELEISGRSLRHTRFRFAANFPDSGFARDSALEERLAPAFAQTDGRFWVFSRSGTPGLAMIQLSPLDSVDEHSLREYAAGIREGATSSGKNAVLADTVLWDDTHHEFSLTMVQKERPLYTRTRCIPTERARTPAYVVCAVTYSGVDDILHEFRESLTIGGGARPTAP